jgi:hypothetical protein
MHKKCCQLETIYKSYNVDIKKNHTFVQYDATENPAIAVDSNISKTCKSSSKNLKIFQKTYSSL